MFLQGVLFGWLVPSQQSGVFPLILIDDFRLRIDEILIIVSFLILILQIILSILSSSKIIIYHPKILFLLLWIMLSVLVSSIRGYLKQNPNNLMDARLLVVPTLFFFIAFSALHTISLSRLTQNLYYLVFPVAVLLTIGSFLPIKQWINSIYEPLGWIYGGIGNGLESVLLFFLALTLSHYILQPPKQYRIIQQVLILFLITGFIVRISKSGWANAIAIIFTVLFITFTVRNYPNISKIRKKIVSRWMRLILIGCIAILIGIPVIWQILPKETNAYIQRSVARILRTDSGDISGGRFELMQKGFTLFLDAPLLGHGTGNQIVPSFWKYKQVTDEQERYMAEHFAPLWFVNRGGLFTFIPVLLLMIWHLLKGFKISLKVAYHPNGFVVVACYTYTIVIAFFFALFGIPQSYFETMILFWLSFIIVHHPVYHSWFQRPRIA
jgi:uncharacterized membrane protein YjjP (DUF1212 family)